MFDIHHYALKTQLAIIAGVLVVFALGASISHWVRSEAQADISTALHRDLAIATKLPRLKSLLRNLDLTTAQYLKTGKPQWLKQHESALDELHRTQQELAELMPGEREQGVLKELDRQLAEHFIKESGWIRQRKSGKLTLEAAAEIIAARRNYEDILEIALNLHDIRIRDFPERRREAKRASVFSFLAVLAVGLVVSALLAAFLSRFIIHSIRMLADYAANWKLGEPWTCRVNSVSPEINSLVARMKNLIEDLNEEYRKEKDLGRLKTQLVSTVSHELNNSLSVIHSASATLEMDEPESKDGKREKMYRMIKGQTRALSTAISNLLNIGRLESGRLALSKKRTDIAKVLRDCVEIMEILCENKGLRISTSMSDSPAPVNADPDALTMVVTNLLSNAVKYTPEGGAVSVGLSQEDEIPGYLRVYVKDTGIGVSQEEKERIFSGYYRSERGKKLAKGFGIGLSLARSILEAHGARLELQSEPEKGSKFSFLLPLWSAEPARANGGQESKAAAMAPAVSAA